LSSDARPTIFALATQRTEMRKHQSGRQDLNLRPLDPQDMALGVSPGKRGLVSDALGVATCGLFGRAHSLFFNLPG
jgi:hypothetical protein